jgi:UDP-N-acetylmuramoyl-tripeptide--D-alanyl-D-alanine ligase
MIKTPACRGFLFLLMLSIPELHKLFLTSSGVSTDSRLDTRNKIFIALSGPNFNGNQYASNALEKGALLAIVDDMSFATNDRFLVVQDSLKCLQNLARFHRRYLDVPVIAITGSNGKTTTKELFRSILSRKYKVHATAGNFNNLIGLPLTILEAKSKAELLLLEMGSNSFGEIEQLCEIAQPDIGLITNIGKSHLEGFVNIKGVLKEKTALYRALKQRDGLAIVRMDDDLLRPAAGDLERVLYFFQSSILKHHYDKIGIDINEHVPVVKGKFMYEDEVFAFTSGLSGAHNSSNIMAAIAIGLHMKVSPTSICEAIQSYVPSNNRSQIIQSGEIQIIMDAYNANPVSMKAAIEMLIEWPNKRKAVILGDMFELGPDSVEEHVKIVEMLKNGKIHQIYLIGKTFSSLKTSEPAYPGILELIEEVPDLRKRLKSHVLLVKGSRSNKLERILKHLTDKDLKDG